MNSNLIIFLFIISIFSCKKNDEIRNIVNIPDIQFENWLIKNGIDSDGLVNGQITRADAEKVTTLNIDHYQNAIAGAPDSKIQNVIGIDSFINLDTLLCSNNEIQSLDCSKLLKLKRLDCFENRITKLNVTKNLELNRLACANNQLTNLEIDSNVKLKQFSCNNNQLTKLNITKNVNLEIIVCSFNKIEALDFSNCSLIKFIQCSYNNLSFLKLGNNPFLSIKSCQFNPNLFYICVNELKDWGWIKDENTQYKICN